MPRVHVEVAPETEKVEVKTIDNLEIKQYFYKPEEIRKLKEDPSLLLDYRKRIEYAINVGFAMFYKDSVASNLVEKYMRNDMVRRLKNHPELTKKLIPSWPPGCRYVPRPILAAFLLKNFRHANKFYWTRRITPGDGYLEALIQENVEPVYEEIVSICSNGLHTADGKFHEVDIIVCATGFDMAWTPHFELLGVDGENIKDSWSPVPNCYLGMAAPGFPNYFVMNGPRSNLGNGTVLPCLETEIEYVIKAAKKMQSDRIKSMNVSQDVTTKLNEYIDKWHTIGVWSAGCKSWYKNNTVDGEIMCWGGSVSSEAFCLCFINCGQHTTNVISPFTFSSLLSIPAGSIGTCRTWMTIHGASLGMERQRGRQRAILT